MIISQYWPNHPLIITSSIAAAMVGAPVSYSGNQAPLGGMRNNKQKFIHLHFIIFQLFTDLNMTHIYLLKVLIIRHTLHPARQFQHFCPTADKGRHHRDPPLTRPTRPHRRPLLIQATTTLLIHQLRPPIPWTPPPLPRHFRPAQLEYRPITTLLIHLPPRRTPAAIHQIQGQTRPILRRGTLLSPLTLRLQMVIQQVILNLSIHITTASNICTQNELNFWPNITLQIWSN